MSAPRAQWSSSRNPIYRAEESTGTDILRSFKQIDKLVPCGLTVYLVLDNLSAHSTPAIVKWLGHRRLRRGLFISVSNVTTAIATRAER